MPELDQPGSSDTVQIDMQAVVQILSEDPLSKALLERAQYLAIVRQQNDELRYLRALRDDNSPPPA